MSVLSENFPDRYVTSDSVMLWVDTKDGRELKEFPVMIFKKHGVDQIKYEKKPFGDGATYIYIPAKFDGKIRVCFTDDHIMMRSTGVGAPSRKR